MEQRGQTQLAAAATGKRSRWRSEEKSRWRAREGPLHLIALERGGAACPSPLLLLAAHWRSGGRGQAEAIWWRQRRVRGRRMRRRHVAEGEENRELIDPKIYDKVILIHFFLTSEEKKERMLEPTGSRPRFPKTMSLEMQANILQGKINVRNRRPYAKPSAPNPCALLTPPQ